MGVLGDIGNAAVEGFTGTSSGTHLKDFLSHFNPSDGKWVQVIDPLTTFEITLKFNPAPNANDSGLVANALNKLGKVAASAVSNALNNITGGLVGALLGNADIEKNRGDFKQKGKESFMEYLAPSNLLVSDNKVSWGDCYGAAPGSVAPLELNLGFYCQDITIPQLSIPDGGTASTLLGDFPINGTVLKPDTNKVTLGILNTKVPLIERIFYPWMREVTLPFWSYESQPYTTADMTVDLTKHADIKYHFYGCRPTYVTLVQPNQQNSEIKRQVTFTFDFMTITSKLKNNDSALKKLLGSGMTLVNSAAKMVNF